MKNAKNVQKFDKNSEENSQKIPENSPAGYRSERFPSIYNGQKRVVASSQRVCLGIRNRYGRLSDCQGGVCVFLEIPTPSVFFSEFLSNFYRNYDVKNYRKFHPNFLVKI